jgi:voltage-gated potassium channel
MSSVARRLTFLGLAVLLVLLGGTAGFMIVEDYSFFDAFYMSLITITTVGYAEVRPLGQAGRVFNSGLLFVGVTMLFLGIGLVTQIVIQLELGELFEKRRMKRQIDNLKDHYIISGLGRVGRGAAVEIKQAGLPFVVIDRNPERIAEAARSGMLAMEADSTLDQTLVDAGIARARGLVAALATDADNLFLILSAKTLNPLLNVAARAGEEGAEQKLRRAGADTVFAPYLHTGHRLAQSLIRPHVLQFLDFATQNTGLNVVIEQLRVAERSEFDSTSLKQMQVRRDTGVIVLAIRRAAGEMLFNPPADAVIKGGDFLVVMGESGNLRRLEHRLAEVRA